MARRRESTAQEPRIFQLEHRTTTRVALGATIAGGAIGIIFAGFQVQGWTVPRLLAIVLLAVLGLVLAGALGMVVYESVRALRMFLEHRSVSAGWISSEPPGLLDYEADNLRAQKALNRFFNKLAKDTTRVGKKTTRGTKSLVRAKDKRGRVKQRRANRTAKHLTRSAVFIERRLTALKKLTKEIERNHQGLIANLPLATEEEVKLVMNWRNNVEGGRTASAEAAVGIDTYRRAVEDFEAMNASRTLRIASDRLGNALRGMVRALKDFETVSAGLVREFDQRLAQGKTNP
jgi:hypothetical protein